MTAAFSASSANMAFERPITVRAFASSWSVHDRPPTCVPALLLGCGVLDAADAYVARTALDLPAEPAAREVRPDPACVTDPLRVLDLAQAGVTAIIWAIGFRQDFGWLRFDTFGPDGTPRHHHGVAAVPGVYFLGLP